MAVNASTKSETYWGVSQGSTWLSNGEAVVPSEVGSGAEVDGWHDAYVASFLFNVECNDSYVAAFLLNLRGGVRS